MASKHGRCPAGPVWRCSWPIRPTRFPVAPVLLGYVLGPMVEENFRRALLMSHGDLSALFASPLSATFMAASAFLILAPALLVLRRRMSSGSAQEQGHR